MPTKAVSLKDNEIMRVQRFSLIPSGAAFTQLEVDTQLSIDRGVIWLIRRIDYDLRLEFIDPPAANVREFAEVQLSRISQSTMVGLSDANIVDNCMRELRRSAAIGTDAGPLWYWADSPIIHHFNPPIPYASANIYLGVYVSQVMVANSLNVRIGYTIETVSDQYFYRVAQALLT